MAVVDVQNISGDKVSQVDLADSIYSVPVKKEILHEVVKMQLASRRSGCAAVKNRSDVRGSTHKLFRQKGTGRARRGNIKSPLLRGGGVVFGPVVKSFAYRVPKKVRRLALKMALSSKLQDKELIVLDKIELSEIKTKKVAEIIKNLNISNALIISAAKDTNLELSARNLSDVKILLVDGLNAYDILKYKHLVILESSIETIERRLVA